LGQQQLEPNINISLKEKPKRNSRWLSFMKKLAKNKAAIVGATVVLIIIILAILAPWIAPYDPTLIKMSEKFQGPSAEHWLGTDDKGRDILSRLLYGSRISLTVGILSTLLGAIVGIVMGVVAGYYGKC